MVGGVTLRRRGERRQPRAADVVGIARSQKDDRRQKRHRLLRRDGKAVGAHERDEGNESPRGPGQGIDAAHATELGDHGVETAGNVGQILLVLQRDPDRALERVGPTRAPAVEQGRRLGPVDRLGDSGRLAQRLAPQLADRGDYGARGRLRDARGADHHDAGLALGARIVDPVIDAAAPQRLVQVARAVGGENDDRMLGRADRAALGNRNLEIGEEFQEERLEFLIGAIDLVDQQHGRIRRAQRRQHRPLDEKRLAVDVDGLLARLPDRQHLAGIVPLVERGGGVDAFVALQADKPSRKHGPDGLRRLRLADAGRSLEQQRLAERQGEIGRRRQAFVGEIIGRAQRLLERFRAADADDIASDRHR